MTAESTVRIWKFHAVPPRDDREAMDVARTANRYYNQLVEIHRRRYERYCGIRRGFAPDLADVEDRYAKADDEVERVLSEIRRYRAQVFRATGKETLAIPEPLDKELEKAKAIRNEINKEAAPLREAFKERIAPAAADYKKRTTELAQELTVGGGRVGPRTKGRANDIVRTQMFEDGKVDQAWKEVAAADEAALTEEKIARESCGLSSGTYQQVEAAFKRAKSDRKGRPTKFHRFGATPTKLAVQLVKTTFADLLAGTSKLRLVPNPKSGKKGERGREFFVCRINQSVKSDDAPRWMSFEVRIHRLPPPDAQVKWAWIRFHKRGERWVYELQLTMSHSDFASSKRPVGVGVGPHVRLGWTQVPDGVRVAMWGDEALTVPQKMLDRAERSGRLRGHADLHYNVVCKTIARWQAMGGRNTLPWHRMKGERGRLWLRSVIVQYAEWMYGADGAKELWRMWRREGHPDLFMPLSKTRSWLRPLGYTTPEEALAFWMYTWAKKDQHLRQWSADARVRFANARDAMFRDVAIRLATQYGSLTVDSYSIADMKKRPAPLTLPGESPNETAQHNVQLAAPGRFREILKEVMGSRCIPSERPGGEEKSGTARKPRNGSRKKVSSAEDRP